MTQVENISQRPQLKKDEDGHVVREIRCTKCRSWLGDEYIFAGRLLLKCFRCGNEMRITFSHIKNHKGK